MVKILGRKWILEMTREMGPALPILLITLIISVFITEFTFTFGHEAVWKTFLRFIRLAAVLVFPLFLLPAICSFLESFFNRGNRALIQVQEDRDTFIHPLKHWVIRPLQGIGLAMLIATKLLTVLQLYTGGKITGELVLPPGHFEVERFFSATAIGVVVSLLLSFLWTLDDLGVRYYNRKTREIRMVGKYVGLFLPILFGFYGVFSLYQEYAFLFVMLSFAQMVIVLYPPFVIFTVLHSRYLRKHEPVVLKRLKARTGFLVNTPALRDEQEKKGSP